MNEEKRKKYQLLKEKNKEKVKEEKWQKNKLLKECLDLLNGHDVLSLKETDVLFERMKCNFPMTNYGRIDWKKISDAKAIENVFGIYEILNKNYEFYILWDQLDIPCVRCKLATIIDNIDDVLAVSFDTWLLSEDEKEVIEFYHDGKVVYGKKK